MLFSFRRVGQRLQRALVSFADLRRTHVDFVRDRDKRLVLDVPQRKDADVNLIQREARDQRTAAVDGADVLNEVLALNVSSRHIPSLSLCFVGRIFRFDDDRHSGGLVYHALRVNIIYGRRDGTE